MTVFNAIVAGICSLLIIVSPCLKLESKAKYNLRFIANILMCASIVALLDTHTGLSSALSFAVTICYIILISVAAKSIEKTTKAPEE